MLPIKGWKVSEKSKELLSNKSIEEAIEKMNDMDWGEIGNLSRAANNDCFSPVPPIGTLRGVYRNEVGEKFAIFHELREEKTLIVHQSEQQLFKAYLIDFEKETVMF